MPSKMIALLNPHDAEEQNWKEKFKTFINFYEDLTNPLALGTELNLVLGRI